MFVSGSESLGNSVPVYCSGSTSFDVRSWKISLKNFQGLLSIVQLSMFFFVVAVSCDSFYIISKCFMFVNNFFISFLLLWSSPSRDSFNRIAHPSQLVNSFFLCFCNSFPFTVLSEFSSIICSEILQFFKIFARMTSACHSLVSVSTSEQMVSYHVFLELSMLFLYFAQFRIFWHQFSHPYSQTDFMLAWKDGWLYGWDERHSMSKIAAQQRQVPQARFCEWRGWTSLFNFLFNQYPCKL